VFKRGIYGTLHHIGQQHLKRYLAESDFRYNDRSALVASRFVLELGLAQSPA
jgi:hypothetical protein